MEFRWSDNQARAVEFQADDGRGFRHACLDALISARLLTRRLVHDGGRHRNCWLHDPLELHLRHRGTWYSLPGRQVWVPLLIVWDGDPPPTWNPDPARWWAAATRAAAYFDQLDAAIGGALSALFHRP
jgi:hypothetical protein